MRLSIVLKNTTKNGVILYTSFCAFLVYALPFLLRCLSVSDI